MDEISILYILHDDASDLAASMQSFPGAGDVFAFVRRIRKRVETGGADMDSKTGKQIMSKIPGRNQTVVVHRGGTKEEPPLSTVVWRWFVTVSVCLIIWAILSPLFVEAIALEHGSDVIFTVVCIIFPLLLVSVSSTRKVIVKTRDQYFPPTNTNNADLPIRKTLVRASSEPMQEQQAVLLRAAAEGQEKYEEQLVRASSVRGVVK